MRHADRPSTTSGHRTHVRAYCAFLHVMDLPLTVTLHNLVVFIEYFHQNLISHKVIASYVSSIRSTAELYNLLTRPFSHPAVTRLLRSISIPTLYNISTSCDSTDDPLLYRAIFLVVFYGFLRMSNIAPHSSQKFNPHQHFLRQVVIFAPHTSSTSN